MKGQAGLFRVVIVVIAILIGLGKLEGNWKGKIAALTWGIELLQQFNYVPYQIWEVSLFFG